MQIPDRFLPSLKAVFNLPSDYDTQYIEGLDRDYRMRFDTGYLQFEDVIISVKQYGLTRTLPMKDCSGFYPPQTVVERINVGYSPQKKLLIFGDVQTR